eukprot:GILK01013063.1.p1 GENE.GILK01013063.1~~GILK01013063.1.p1  ORF type:complete len:438 (-),score=44.29 GILK01013063.1:33-1346(-)
MAIGRMLDSVKVAAEVVVTSLDPRPFEDLAIESKQGWDWLPLNPVHEGVAELFDPKIINSIFASQAVKSAIVECSGHPRTLQSLYLDAKRYPIDHPPDHLELIRNLVANCAINITRDMLKPVILQSNVPVNGTLSSSSTLTYKDLAARSIYLNSLRPDDTFFVPLKSTVLMRKFAQQHHDSESDRLDAAVAHVLEQLFAAADHTSFVSFEQFRAHFELLRRLLKRKRTYLSKQYPLAQYFGFNPETVTFYTTRTFNSCLLPKTFAESCDQGVLSDTKTIFTYPHNNPGFYATLMQRKRKENKKDRILLCWETRLSADNATTVTEQGVDEMVRKHALTMQAVQEALDFSADPAPDVYLIILAYRRVSKYQAATLANIPANTIVMNREALMKLYGAFQFRASFLADTLGEWELRRSNKLDFEAMAAGSRESDQSMQPRG